MIVGRPIGMKVGAHQVVGSRLRRRIRTVGRVRSVFAECRIIGAKRAIDLVCRYVEEAKLRTVIVRQLRPIRPRCFQQHKRPPHICFDERLRPQDRAIHVTFRREMQNGARPVFFDHLIHARPVADIGPYECIVRVIGDLLQVA